MPLLHGAHSGTMTLPVWPMAPRWMCAWSAGPLRCEKVSFHVSVLPLSVAWKAPFAAGTLMTCFGISWAAVSVADQPMPRGAPSETAASASAAATTSANGASFLTIPYLPTGVVERYFAPGAGPFRSGGGGRNTRPRLLERQFAPFHVDADRVAVCELPVEEPQCEGVLDEPLDRPLERPRAVRRIPPRLGERFLSRIRELEHDPPLREPIAQPGELQLDDLGDLLTRERLELDDLVNPVQELGPEAVL